MKSKIPAMLSDLKDSLELLGVEGLIPSVEAIERAYNEERAPKPKKAAAKKPAAKVLTLVITNAHGESEIHFETEAKAEAWMKTFRKDKDKQVEAYMKANNLSFPEQYRGEGWTERYRKDIERHKERMKAAGLDTQILIKH